MAEFINKIPVNVNRIEGNENVMNLEPILEGKEQVTFDEESINSQKNCVPGPNVKFNKNAFNIILTFIEQLSKDIDSNKYIEIIDLFLKKFHKGKVVEIKLSEKIYHPEFYEKLQETADKFISWLFL